MHSTDLSRTTLVRGRLRFYVFCTSLILLLLGSAICISACAGLLENDSPAATREFLLFGFLEIVIGSIGWILFRDNRFLKKNQLNAYEAFFTITFCWCITSLLGAIPLLFEGLRIEDAILESFSMFTTTGSVLSENTVLADGKTLSNGINSLSGALIFYRCFEAWLGGMGTIALILVFLPVFRQKNQILPCAEVSGLKSFEQRASSRLAFSAWKICIVYILLTLLLYLLLLLVTNENLTCFDALCCALTTISTSGAGPDCFSVFSYGMPAVLIIILFMLLSSCNFNIYVLFFTNGIKRFRYGRHAGTERTKNLLFNDETVFFLTACFASAVITAALLFLRQRSFENFTGGIIDSLFATVSFMSTTGFSPNPTVSFPVTAVLLFFILNLCGGCSGSTSSGLKAFRCIIIFKQCVLEIRRILSPHQVSTVYLNHERRDISAIHKIFAFFALYVMMLLLFAILLPLCSPNGFGTFSDAFSLSLSNLTNTGLVCKTQIGGLASFEAFDCCQLSVVSKLLMCLEMLLGRLEIYTVLVLLLPHFSWGR